jgi:hypothetical protein
MKASSKMATNKSTAIQQDQIEALRPTEYAFQPVQLGHPEINHASLPGAAVQLFADKVEAVTMGAASILRLIEWDDLRKMDYEGGTESEQLPILNNYHRGVLLRMMAVNMDLIAERASDIRTWAYEQHTTEGKAQVLADAMRMVRRCENMAGGSRS